MVLLIISFIAGVLTVLAPCILPLLPVIVGGSLTGEGKDAHKKKVLTIVGSLGLSVIAFTLLLKASTLFISIPEDVWKWISGSIIIVLGLVTIFPSLWEGQWLSRLSAKSNQAVGFGNQKKNFWGDVIIGASLGPVFSTCSPTYFIVLATVLPAEPITGIVYLLTYTLGLCLSLFVIAFIGQKIMTKLNIAADPRGWLKRSLGALFLIVGVAIISGFDKKLQVILLDAGVFDVTKIEQRLLELTGPDSNENQNNQRVDKENVSNDIAEDIQSIEENGDQNTQAPVSIKSKSDLYSLAPEISSPDGFVNTNGQAITLKELRGKVVLLDIWTYSCINCQRTIPYINDWYKKYQDQGLEIIGLHTPEFAFERLEKNVANAVEKFGIKYPVVLDNDYSTWHEYGNQYWPRKYLIDTDGYIVYDHIGEGGYGETEQQIQKALKERADRLKMKASLDLPLSENTVKVDSASQFTKVGSPEIYFGSSRNSRLANGQAGVSGEQTLVIPSSKNINSLYLGGKWNITPEYAETSGMTEVAFRYTAKFVYMVAGSSKGVEVDVFKDGNFVKTINVKDEGLYTLIADTGYGEHLLELKIKSSDLKVFTFTFG